MKFAVIVDYKADDPKLGTVRPVHRQYLAELRDKGKLAISGPFTEGGGALIVLETDSKEEAEAIVKSDPFTKEGVFQSWVIRPWNPVFINRSVLPE
jgi:uncharacterized protein YciI